MHKMPDFIRAAQAAVGQGAEVRVGRAIANDDGTLDLRAGEVLGKGDSIHYVSA